MDIVQENFEQDRLELERPMSLHISFSPVAHGRPAPELPPAPSRQAAVPATGAAAASLVGVLVVRGLEFSGASDTTRFSRCGRQRDLAHRHRGAHGERHLPVAQPHQRPAAGDLPTAGPRRPTALLRPRRGDLAHLAVSTDRGHDGPATDGHARSGRDRLPGDAARPRSGARRSVSGVRHASPSLA